MTTLLVICLQKAFCEEQFRGACAGALNLGGGTRLSGVSQGQDPGPTPVYLQSAQLPLQCDLAGG